MIGKNQNLLWESKTAKSLWEGVFVFFGVFVLYYFTRMTQVVPYGDSGELTTAAHMMYTPHSPGYPIYIVVFKFFSSILSFIPEIYERQSVATAINGAVNAVLFYFVLKRIYRNRLLALSGTIMMSFCLLTWVYHVVPEVFSLANTMLLCQILSLLLWTDRKEKRSQLKYIYVFSLFLGLGFISHWITVIAWPGYFFHIIAVMRTEKRKYSFIPYLLSPLLVALGVSTSLIIFYLSSRLHPPFFNLEPTWPNFFDHFFRRLYAWSSHDERTLEPVNYYFQYTWSVWLMMLPFGILGFYGALRKAKKFGFVFIGFLLTGPMALYYQNMPVDTYVLRGLCEKFYLTSYHFLTILICLGLQMTSGWINSKSKKASSGNEDDEALSLSTAGSSKSRRFLTTLPQSLGHLVRSQSFYVTILLISVFLFPVRNAVTLSKADDPIGAEVAKKILDSVPDNSIIFAGDDQTSFPLLYMVNVKRYKDKRLVLLPGAFSRITNYKNFKAYTEWISFRRQLWVNTSIINAPVFLRDFLDANREVPIFFTASYYKSTIGMRNNPYNVEPYGLLFRIIYKKPTGENIDNYQDFLIDRKYMNKNYELPGAIATQNMIADCLLNALLSLEYNGLNDKARELLRFINDYAPNSKIKDKIEKRLEFTTSEYDDYIDKRATKVLFRPTKRLPLKEFISAKQERIELYQKENKKFEVVHELEDLLRYENRPEHYWALITLYAKMGHVTATRKWIDAARKNFPNNQQLIKQANRIERKIGRSN